MATAKYHLQGQEIPDGLQVFDERLEVAGVSFRKSDAASFAGSKNGWLEFEREYGNKHDNNAIRVIGCNKRIFGTKRRFIGYVPKDVARMIVDGGFWGKIQPRLLKTYVGDGGFVEILFQILGPKGQKYQFKQPQAGDGGHYTDYVERVKQLKAEEKNMEAIELLLKLVDQTEREVKARDGRGVAPWYYEQLAVLYKKEKRYDDEIAILERYESQLHAPGAGPQKLADRLLKARQRRDQRERSGTSITK